MVFISIKSRVTTTRETEEILHRIRKEAFFLQKKCKKRSILQIRGSWREKREGHRMVMEKERNGSKRDTPDMRAHQAYSCKQPLHPMQLLLPILLSQPFAALHYNSMDPTTVRSCVGAGTFRFCPGSTASCPSTCSHPDTTLLLVQ